MDKLVLKTQKKISNSLKPQFNLGKLGITQTFLKTIDEYLIANQIVKIKVSIAKDKKDLEKFAEKCVVKLNAELVEAKGFTFTLYRST